MSIICQGLEQNDFSVEFIEHQVTLGRDPGCGIVLESFGISKKHAVLIEQDGAILLKDCDSLNGTFLNGKRLASQEILQLSGGDVIRIGLFQFQVVISPESRDIVLFFLPESSKADTVQEISTTTLQPNQSSQNLSSKEPEQSGDPFISGSLRTKDYFSPGRIIGKYKIIKQIGKGGMGEIFLAKHLHLDSLVVLKVLPPRLMLKDSDFLIRFIREAKLAAEIKHSNIVSVMDVENNEDIGLAYIVMEYMDGGSLRNVLDSVDHLSEEQAVTIVEDVALALHAAEERNIVHRDIKPDNIMFTKRGEVKLTDLGIAKNEEENINLTRSNIMIGTPAYLSPEQVKNAKDVDIRADIYSLGATFYQMLTGRPPYSGESAFVIVQNMFSLPVPDPRDINPEISPACAEIVMKMLAKDPADRFQHASELVRALELNYPPRTAIESSELVKKALSGIAENSAEFNTKLNTTGIINKIKFRFASFRRNIRFKHIAVAGTVVMIFAAGAGAFYFIAANRGNESQSFGLNQTMSQTPLTLTTIPNADVKLTSANGQVYSAKSNNLGVCMFPNLPPGNYDLLIECAGYHSKKLNLEHTTDSSRTIELEKITFSMILHSTPGAQVQLLRNNRIQDTFIIPESGELPLSDLEPGNYSVKIDKPGYLPYKSDFTAGAEKTISCVLAPIEKQPDETPEMPSAPAADSSGKQTASPSNNDTHSLSPAKSKDSANTNPAPADVDVPAGANSSESGSKAASEGQNVTRWMSVNWFTVLILYFWFLAGLYAVKRLNMQKKKNPYQVLLACFIGPFALGWIWVQENSDRFKNVLKFKKKTAEENFDYLNLVFLDNRGRDLFAGKSEDSEVIHFVKKMIYDAVTRNSSDIFMDPKDDAYVVRFRVDGAIRIYDTMMETKALSAISMIKAASGMDIAEKRRPQDGMFSVLYEGVNFSFRVATVGVFAGEKITIRVISSENSKRDLNNIGLSPEQLSIVRNGVKLPSGMILMCGPTGSGKTSTLYSMLGAIDYSMKNVISIEDPIERVVPHISQMEVNVKAGITFASLLRNALRQNPDVICVGEIRDEETAEVAAHAAQTGHLIIATLHSNDNIGTIIRLTDLGVPLRSIAACLHLIISQRLVRKLCPHCRKKAELTAEQQEFCRQYGIPTEALCTAPGCAKCDHTGFSGRQAVFEILTMTNELRAVMEASGSSVSAIQEYIENNQGDDSIFNITGNMLLRGEIPLEEFERVNINF